MMKSYIKKIVVYGIIILFFGTSVSVNPCIAYNTEEQDPLCYGFIVPLFKCENITIKEQIIGKTRHMINDFLREQIPVYWTATNGTVSIREAGNIEDEKEIFFEKGTFIIPFTRENCVDTKIIAIVCDYNQSSEIEENNTVKIPIFFLMESVHTSMYVLSEVKIAFFKTYLSSDIPEYFFLEIARKCGFLTFDIINEYDTREGKLNNNMFNVMIWGWDPDGFTRFRWNVGDILYNVSKSIRVFVENGGGYIGCCAGAYRASCEAITNTTFGRIKTNHTRQAYNPNLNSYGLLAISDVAVNQSRALLDATESKIMNNSHPVTFGLDTIVTDWMYGGPRFYRIGKNSEVIAQFYDPNTTVNGTPSWVSSRFCKGRVVLFSPHPEFVESEFGHTGKTVHSNALYYTTFKEITEPTMSNSKNLSFIMDTWEKTLNVTIGENGMVFSNIINSINETIDEIENLHNYSSELIKHITIVAEKKKISPNLLGNQSITLNLKILKSLTEYFGCTIETLEMTERIYPLLENNTEFIQEIETLKNDLSLKINETRKICKENLLRCKILNVYLRNYENLTWQKRSIFKELKINNTTIIMKREIAQGFNVIPQTYFNSLKLLRSSWYIYESTVAL